MRSEACPDQSELQDLLLGRSTGEKRIKLEKHYLSCPKCASNSESIAISDDLTQALSNKSRPSGNENELQSAITQAKTLAILLDTVADRKPIAENVTSPAEPNTGHNDKQSYRFLAPPQQEDEIGRFANYRILEVLGSGGMGIVFRAEDQLLKRVVALKVMKPAVAAKSKSKSRFIREAQATAALSHDHIVQIYQVGEERGTPFIAMQYLAGQSLQAVLDKSKKLRQSDVVRIGAEVALGLSVAHEKGLIHRDIKPDNIWIEAKSYRAKILDFGLARDLSVESELTQTGVILGTPSYMAPEQIAGQEIGAGCDLFSLGCVLYYLACGQRPFASANIAGLLIAISNVPPVPIEQRASGLHPRLIKLIMQLLEKDPKQRPVDAATVARELKQIQVDLRAKQLPKEQATTLQSAPSLQTSKGRKPPRSRWPLIAMGGAAFFALLLGTIVITIRNRDGQETTIRVPSGVSTNVDAQPGSEVHGVDFLCSIDFSDTRSLIMCGGVDGLCMERCVVATGDNGTKGIVQGIVIYSNGWARDGANPADFKGNCIRNCVIATNRIVLLEGGGTTYFSRNLMMFGPAIEDERYASSMATFHSKVLHTLVISENVMVHHGGAAQFFFHGDPDTASRIVLRHNTFHGKTENLAVIYENALAQQFEFVNNLGVHSSNLVYSDPKFLRSSKLQSSGNQSLTSDVTGGSQLSLFTATPWKVLSLSPLDRNAWRIDSNSQGTEESNQAPGALPFGPVAERNDWFTELQDRFKASLVQMPEEAREYWSRPLDVSPK